MSEPISTLFGVKITNLIAGAAGGFVRAIFLKQKFRVAIGSIITGMIFAHYLTPMAIYWLPQSWSGDPASEGAIGFVLGQTALTIFTGVATYVKRWAANPTLKPGDEQ